MCFPLHSCAQSPDCPILNKCHKAILNKKIMSQEQQNQELQQELTFGQKAVGLTFNPSKDPEVDRCKQIFADAIDQMQALRTKEGVTPGVARHASTAITMIEDAQMRAVKALTWRD